MVNERRYSKYGHLRHTSLAVDTEAPPTCFLSQSEESHLKGRGAKTACFRQRWMHRGLVQENCEPHSATLKAKKKENGAGSEQNKSSFFFCQ